MKKRLVEVINQVQYDDLVKIEKDLNSGGRHLRRLVHEKIVNIEKDIVKICATCGNKLNPYYIDDFKLIFGRRDFKKRAYFCGTDCLKHFLSTLTEDFDKNLV